ncbi:MAG: rRNA pseudouridine synthase, partial [Bacteroidetes bacterium]|nr:rRNA pseudouridine synthase [Bacteroidota bacterium]
MRPLKYFALHKPYGYLSQFTDSHSKSGLLGELYHFPKDVYAVGRLDKDSEGLLFLTNDKAINHQFLNPENEHARTYWVQLDGEITNEAIDQLTKGVSISDIKKKYQTK